MCTFLSSYVARCLLANTPEGDNNSNNIPRSGDGRGARCNDRASVLRREYAKK